MALLLSQVQELIQRPANKALIQRAQRHEQRLKFHIETALDRSDVTHSANLFFDWVEDLLPKEKFRVFLALFTYPVATNDLTEQMFHSLEKVFDGRDPFFDYDFISPEAKQDYLQDYKPNFLGGQERWENEGFIAMKSAINSIMVVDMPRFTEDSEGKNTIQETSRPTPYYYWKPIHTFHDFGKDKDSTLNYVMFFQNDNTELIVIDDESYRLFTVNDKKQIVGEAQVEANHELSYCPSRFFWTTPLKIQEAVIKKSPISNQLSNLDRLLFSIVSKDHLDLYAAYPIYWAYEVDCDFEHPETGEFCDGGFIKSRDDKYSIDRAGSVARCPVCWDKRASGAGSMIEVPVPSKEDDQPDLKNPVGLLSVDKGSLEYNSDKIDKNKTEIYTNVVGFGGDMPNDQAINKLQIAASFESRTTVLVSLKKNFEKAQEWVESTICRLRYGELFKSFSANYGTQFYLFSVKDLVELYKAAKEAGASDFELDNIQDQIIETQHRNNPIALRRAKLLLQLEPFRHLSKKEVLEARQLNPDVFDTQDVAIKIKFSNFITRFERENISILEFGSLLSMDKKVESILKTLKSYDKIIKKPESSDID